MNSQRGRRADVKGEGAGGAEGLVALPGWTMGPKLLTCILGVIPSLFPAPAPGLGSESQEHPRQRPGGCEGHVGVFVLPVPPPGVW